MIKLRFQRIKQALIFSFCLLAIFTVYSQSNHLAQKREIAIDNYINEVTKKYGITGTAVAILKDGKVIYKKYQGKSNLEYNIPISEQSLFRMHSLSKIFVSVGIFQLIEKNKISLEDKISKYLEDLPQSWKHIKIKHLLSHSSGLPDVIELESNSDEKAIAEIIYKKEKRFKPGDKADYNQTNFWLLNRIIRKISKRDFKEFILKDQFDSNDKEARFSNIQEIIPHRISEYKPNKKGQLKNFYFKVPEYLYGAAGLHITLNKFIEWDKKLNDESLLKISSKKKMLAPFIYKKGKGFTEGGWDLQSLNGFSTYGFNGGGLVNYRRIPSKNLSIIWLTNGYSIPYPIERVTNAIAGLIDENLKDVTPLVFKSLKKSFLLKKEQLALSDFSKVKKQYPFINYESVLNSLGYQFMKEKKINKAIYVFKLNTKEYSNSANTFDSLAEAYFINKENNKAKKNYEKAIALGGTRGNAKKMLQKINEIKRSNL
ncbi:beta-lactamase family protein [Tenacibaculum aiptasiae]|uniref:Beta-lactamase family protein n=1 Tax=Tenacibaculum aiptasiae TaxID=426481 RepID=A0A7J5A9M4_9FLAO|nr:serine hydrolase domain-containing protein [Tenacibaculum aiptasiae]KAB1154215.1 beta-lactamase family protein [Tenacibaculum aiptasiae]